MSAPNLIWWLPLTWVQLLTNWNCCSLSVSGQLQRATPSPSPKLETTKPLLPELGAPFSPLRGSAPSKKAPRPFVLGSPGMLAPGIPKPVIGVPLSGLLVTGLYLKYPNRKSVSQLVVSVLLKPVARL